MPAKSTHSSAKQISAATVNILSLTTDILSIVSPLKTHKSRLNDSEYMNLYKTFGIKKCRCAVLKTCTHLTYCIYCRDKCNNPQKEHLHARRSTEYLPNKTRWNEFPCCSSCNQSKGKKSVEEWLASDSAKSLKGRGKSQKFIDELRNTLCEYNCKYEQMFEKASESQLKLIEEFNQNVKEETRVFLERLFKKAEETKQKLFVSNYKNIFN